MGLYWLWKYFVCCLPMALRSFMDMLTQLFAARFRLSVKFVRCVDVADGDVRLVSNKWIFESPSW